MTESGNFSEPPPPTSYLNSENPTSADNRLSNGPYGLFRFYFFLPFRPETSRARIQTTRCGGLALESSLITTVKSNRNFLVNGARFPSLLVKNAPLGVHYKQLDHNFHKPASDSEAGSGYAADGLRTHRPFSVRGKTWMSWPRQRKLLTQQFQTQRPAKHGRRQGRRPESQNAGTTEAKLNRPTACIAAICICPAPRRVPPRRILVSINFSLSFPPPKKKCLGLSRWSHG